MTAIREEEERLKFRWVLLTGKIWNRLHLSQSKIQASTAFIHCINVFGADSASIEFGFRFVDGSEKANITVVQYRHHKKDAK